MTHPDQEFHKIGSLSVVERKEYEELKQYHSKQAIRKRERTVFLGYCVVGILATMSIYGLLNFDQLSAYVPR
jgi:hypothetical protein